MPRSVYVPAGYNELWTDEFDDLSLEGSTVNPRWYAHFNIWNTWWLQGNSDGFWKDYEEHNWGSQGSVGAALDAVYNDKTRYLHDVSNSTLKLRCYPMPAAVKSDFFNYDYIAGMIEASGIAQEHGYWEVRFRINNISTGMHLAIWLIADDGVWPPEIDLMEAVSGIIPGADTMAGLFATGFHNEEGTASPTDQQYISMGNMYNGWNVIGGQTVAGANGIRVHFNGVTRYVTNNTITAGKKLLPIISWEGASTWPGDPDESTIWPGEVEIDYVRVYSAGPGALTVRDLSGNGIAPDVGGTPEGSYGQEADDFISILDVPEVRAALQEFVAAETGGAVTVDNLTGITAEVRAFLVAVGLTAMRSVLDLGTAAQSDSTDFKTAFTVLPVNQGGTGAPNAPAALAALGAVAASLIGAANGLSTLDATGKVPTAQLPANVSQTFKGAWNATTNTPALAAGTGTNGDTYRVQTAGTRNIGEGSTAYAVGDAVVYNTTLAIWQRIGRDDLVSSIFGRLGAIVAASGDYTALQVTNTPAGNIAAVTVQAALNELDAEKALLSHTHTVSQISDSGAKGRQLVAAATMDAALALLATGTRDSTTFIRGDGTFAVPPGVGGGSSASNGAGNSSGVTASPAQAVTTTNTIVTGSTFTITPSSAQAKVRFLVAGYYTKDANTTSRTPTLQLRRGTTVAGSTLVTRGSASFTTAITGDVVSFVFEAEDSPASAASVSYILAIGGSTAGGTLNTIAVAVSELAGTFREPNVIYAADYGVLFDGTTDDTTGWNAAITAASTLAVSSGQTITVKGKAGTTTRGLGIVQKTGVDIDLCGGRALKIGGAAGTYVFLMNGTESATTTTTTGAVTTGAVSIPLTSISGFAVGDVFRIKDSQLFFGAGPFPVHHMLGEILTASTTMVPRDGVKTKLAQFNSGATVVKMNAIRGAKIRNGTVQIPAGTAGGGIDARYCFSSRFDDLTIIGAADKQCISIYECAHTHCYNVKCYDSQLFGGGEGYGISIGSSHDCEVHNCDSAHIRENAFADASTRCKVVGGRHQFNIDTAWNTHGQRCSDIVFESIEAVAIQAYMFAIGFSGCSARDEDITFINCNAFGLRSSFLSSSSKSSSAGDRNVRITVLGGKAIQCLRSAAGNPCLYAEYNDELTVRHLVIDGKGVASTASGMTLYGCNIARIIENTVRHMSLCYGIRTGGSGVDNLFRGNHLLDNGSGFPQLDHYDDTVTKLRWQDNELDVSTVTAGSSNPARRSRNALTLGGTPAYDAVI